MPNTPRRLRVFQSYDPPLYFVTFNTYHRLPLLANELVHDSFVAFAEEAKARGVSVGRYVLMPDHVHLFVRLRIDFVLSQWIRLLKRKLSCSIVRPMPHWQNGFFDHIIRHSESYAAKWRYVMENPVRAGLIGDAEKWRYQGEIVGLQAE